MSTGANGRSYEDNYAEHERLLAEVGKRNEEARQAEAARDAVSAELRQGGNALPPEQVKALNNELADRQAVVDDAKKQLEDAHTAVGALELAAGSEQAGWLEERMPPGPPKDLDLREMIAEGVRKGVEQINEAATNAKESVQELGQAAAITYGVLTGQPTQHLDPHLQPQTVIEMPKPPASPEVPFDLDQKMGQLARDPSREEERRKLQEFEQSRKTYEDALASAPSREPPGPDPMAVKHEQERQRLEDSVAKRQKEFEDRHDRLNTDPMILNGFQERLNEQFEAERRLQAERQERERLERLQDSPGIVR